MTNFKFFNSSDREDYFLQRLVSFIRVTTTTDVADVVLALVYSLEMNSIDVCLVDTAQCSQSGISSLRQSSVDASHLYRNNKIKLQHDLEMTHITSTRSPGRTESTRSSNANRRIVCGVSPVGMLLCDYR